VPITTNIVSSNCFMAWYGIVYTTICDTDRHDKTEILLKEALNNITLTLQFVDKFIIRYT
jgi:hypothetical protein